VLGAAWMIGALGAVENATGTDVRSFDVIVGTSAGSVITALLAAGISVEDQREHQLGRGLDGPLSTHGWDYDTATGGSMPPLPRLGPGSPALVARNVRRLRRLPPTAVLSAFVPVGRGSLTRVGSLVDYVLPGQEWPDRDGIWVVTMNYETGRRVVFGQPDSPTAGISDAVMASCAIPGWFAPVVIDHQRYVDGGACSATSVDVLAGLGLDEVYVVAPMVSFELDHPRSLVSRLERHWRARVTRRCVHEANKLRAEGTEVVILGPGPEDLAEIGGNVMHVARRLRVLETSTRTADAALARARQWADAG
jgi:NTE family protein